MDWLRELEALEVPEPIEAEGEIPTLRTVVETQAAAPREPEALASTREAAVDRAAPTPEQSLTVARSHLDGGALDAAAKEYEHLAATGSLQGDVVRDLEQAVENYPEHPALQRALGDAYMRSGQLQRALQAYQDALAKM